MKEKLVMERAMLESLGYKINNRTFGSLQGVFSDDYRGLSFPYENKDVVYTGAEHSGSPKLPNLTCLPNMTTTQGEVILGSTFGHQHIQSEGDDRRFQEIYEFQGYGGMLLRDTEGARLYLLSPEEKVVTRQDEAMTIFNFGVGSLKTADYANPLFNKAHKNLEENMGPVMLGKFDSNVGLLSFVFNQGYVEKGLLPSYSGGKIEISTGLGEDLLKNIQNSRDDFRESGIEVILGGNVPDDLKKEFDKPLVNLVLEQNKVLFDILKLDCY